MKQVVGEKQFYQLYFQEPGKAEAEFEADVRKTILTVLYSASGDVPRTSAGVFRSRSRKRFSTAAQYRKRSLRG